MEKPKRAQRRKSDTAKADLKPRFAVLRILSELSVQLHPQKTRVVHVQHGFEFLGYLVRRGRQLTLPTSKIVTGAKSGGLYAYPREKSVQRFKDRVRQLTRR